jgi:hypothetical protein
MTGTRGRVALVLAVGVVRWRVAVDVARMEWVR